MANLFPDLIAHTATGGTGSAVTTSAIDSTGATILIAVTSYKTGTITVTDSKSNTWTGLTQRIGAGGGGVICQIFYAVNPTVGASHTVTGTAGASTFPAIAVAAFNTVLTSSPFDVQNGAGDTGATGSITPSVNGELLISGMATSATPTAVSTSISTIPQFGIANAIATVPGTSFGVSLAWNCLGTAAAISTTWSSGGSANAVAIASFKCSSPGGGGTGGAWAFA